MEPTFRRSRRTRGNGCSRTRLPADIVLFEILPWLPVRTILKLKCVCRDWHRLLSGGSGDGGGGESHHRFSVEQFERSLRRPSPAASGTIYINPGGDKLLYQGFDGTFMQLPIPINPSSSSGGICIKNIVASTNGLCCLLCFRDQPGHVVNSNADTPFIYICNPFTGRSGEQVPLTRGETFFDSFAPYPMWRVGGRVRALALAFEPSEVDYKLVEFDCVHSCRQVSGGLREECEFRFSLYSSDSGCWVESESKLTTVSPVIDNSLTIFWRTFYGEGKVYWDCYTFAVQYDIGRDAASHLEMPEFHIKDTILIDQKMELREGRLTCTRLSTRLSDLGYYFDVWVLLGDGGNKEWRWERKEWLRIRLNTEKAPISNLLLQEATAYEDEDRKLCLQLMYNSFCSFSGLVHYNIREKKSVCGRTYRSLPTWKLTTRIICRHYDSLHDVPSRANVLNLKSA